MNKYIFLISLAVALTTSGNAQNIEQSGTKLTGEILTLLSLSADSVNSEKLDSTHLSNQQIKLIHVKEKIAFDAWTENGKFTFYNIKPGRYKLIVDDPQLNNVQVILVDVRYSSRGRASLKPIILDRVNQLVKVKKT
jgi:hypothetical protein